MTQIAGLQDFRQEGAPADVGLFEVPTDMLVFKFTFSGITYVVAMRSGDRGWILVDYRVDTPVNCVAVIQSGLNALPAPRVWMATCTVIGSYIINERVNVPAYTELDITMARFEFQNNATPTPVTYRAVDYNVMIYVNSNYVNVVGGWLDGNGDNQEIHANWALLYVNNASYVKLLKTHVEDCCFGVDTFGNFRAFCYFFTVTWDVVMDGCYGYHAGYEIVAIRGDNHYFSCSNGYFEDGFVHVIQCANAWLGNPNESTFVSIGPNNTFVNGNGYQFLFTCHTHTNVWFHHNKCRALTGLTGCGIKIIGTSSDIWIENNDIISESTVASCNGIRLGETTVAGTLSNLHITSNRIKTNVLTGHGITIGSGAVTLDEIYIFHNDINCLGTDSRGIYQETGATNVNRIYIETNKIRSASRCVSFEGLASSWNTIIDNKLYATDYGCTYLKTVTYSLIIGNSCRGAWGLTEASATGCDFNRYLGNNCVEIAAAAQRLTPYGIHTICRDNVGVDPWGNVTNPFLNSAPYIFGYRRGTVAGPTVANQDYICAFTDCILDITLGTGVNVTLKDHAANVISVLGATPIHALYVPANFLVNFGNFSVAPTVAVSAV